MKVTGEDGKETREWKEDVERGGVLSYPNVMALAALTRYGFCCPPAPSEFNAFHIPGSAKDTRPVMMHCSSVPLQNRWRRLRGAAWEDEEEAAAACVEGAKAAPGLLSSATAAAAVALVSCWSVAAIVHCGRDDWHKTKRSDKKKD